LHSKLVTHKDQYLYIKKITIAKRNLLFFFKWSVRCNSPLWYHRKYPYKSTNPVTKRNNSLFSLFKGRGTQSQFLKTFYEFMKHFIQLTILLTFKFYKWPIYSAKFYKYVTEIWIYVTNMRKIDDFYLIFTMI